MRSRERVLLAINHKEPDRIPIFSPNLIPTYKPLDKRIQHFLDTFEFDRLVKLNFIKTPSRRRKLAGEVYIDLYGCLFKYKGVGNPYCIYHPLAYVKKIEDVEKFKWPDPNDPNLLLKNASKMARKISEETEYATAINIDTLFHRYHALRGFNQWLIDLKLNPGLHKAIADKIYHINLTLTMRLLNEVGEYTDIVMTGDDLGTSTRPYVSLQDFRKHIKPYFKNLIGEIKRSFPHIKFYLHSHGQIMDFIPDLIDCGVDILNPILPLDGMDPIILKRKYGNQLCFCGGIDVEHILPFGTLADVKKHVKEVIDILAPGGGYIFKVQAISYLISYEKLITAYKIAVEYGRYR